MQTSTRARRPRVLSVGEVLWDLLPAGPQLGGAPANFAFHTHALGGNAALISCVGEDELGAGILTSFRDAEMPTEWIQRDETQETGTVDVELTPEGQPRYHIIGDVAWDYLIATDRALEAAAGASAICFGTLAQRAEQSRDAIRAIVTAVPETALRICDINLREPFFSEEVIRESLAMANVLKLNEGEMETVAGVYGITTRDTREFLAAIASAANLRVVALTRGGEGSVLWRDGEASEHPGVPATVRDTIGAGDAFTAAMMMGLLAGWPLDAINARANEVAAYVCSHAGATPRLPRSLTFD